jgi:pseudaminic acid synthase
MKKELKINNNIIGYEHPAYIIAELSTNHLNNFKIVEKTIEAAAKAGVNALKLVTLTPETMTINSDKPDFIINANSKWDGRTFYDLYSETSMKYEWHEKIIDLAKNYNLDCFSTPYDITAAEFLKSLNMPAYKIASFEITDTNLIRKVASYKKPVILSTGIATKDEIEDAINACIAADNNEVILLKCTSGYPAPFEELNLKAIHTFKEDFDVIVGLSDHTLGIEVPIAAVALGAKVIEKHIILDRSLGGPDAHFSLEPSEFASLVRSIRNIEKSLGDGSYFLSEASKNSRVFSRSLYIVKNVRRGEIITEDNVRSIRPGYGMKPKYLNNILGKRFNADYEKGTRMTEDKIL